MACQEPPQLNPQNQHDRGLEQSLSLQQAGWEQWESLNLYPYSYLLSTNSLNNTNSANNYITSSTMVGS